MNKTLSIGLACVALCACSGAARADGAEGETRPVDARVTRVHVDGPFDLRIRQGRAPTLTLSGDPRFLGNTVTEQHGDMLSIESEGRGRVRLGTVRVELTLPALREVTADTLGTTDIAGFSGEAIELTLDGAGSMRMDSSYRMVTVNLGGVGSMHLQGMDADGIKVNLQGAGLISLGGRARWLKADLSGVGSLEARALTVENVNAELSGLGNAHVTARQSVNLNLSGMGSATVYGKPLNRKVAVDGLGKVSWQ